MAKLSKSDAAKAIGVSRQTLYSYTKSGRISIDPDGLIDTAELLRAGFVLRQIGHEEGVQTGHGLTWSENHHPSHNVKIDALHQQVEALARERDLLQRELDDAKQEKARLLSLLESQQRLLEAAKPEPLLPRIKAWVQGIRLQKK